MVVPVAMRELRWLTWLPIALFASLLTLSLLTPTAAGWMGLPLAVVGSLVGIPHGAVDHLLPWWWVSQGSAGRPSLRAVGLFAAAYAAVALVALAGLLLATTATLVVFLVLSAVHFGRGEVVTSAERAGRTIPLASADWPVALAHGATVVGLLVWSRPEATEPVLRSLSPWLADVVCRTREGGVLLVAITVGVGIGVLLRTARHLEAAELGLLVAVFAVAPPLAAFGLYFGAWHAPRHMARLLDLARRQGDDAETATAGWRPATTLLGRSAALPTVAALAVVAVLWALRDLATFQAEVAVLLALTFPHAGVVWALDRREALTASDPNTARPTARCQGSVSGVGRRFRA